MLEADDHHKNLATALAPDGIRCQLQRPHQLVVSRQVGRIWPDRGNSFWVTHATGSWHLFTWAPRGYRVPDDIDLADVCRACMAHGEQAMIEVPEHIVEQFRLECLSDTEQKSVLKAMDGGT